MLELLKGDGKMTAVEKLSERRGYIKAAFTFMVLIPVCALVMLMTGIDPSPANVIFSTSSATFGSLIIGHFATTPKDDKAV